LDFNGTLVVLVAFGIGAHLLARRLRQNNAAAEQERITRIFDDLKKHADDLSKEFSKILFDEFKIEAVKDARARNVANVSFRDLEQGLFFRVNPRNISNINDERFTVSKLVEQSGRLEIDGVVWRLPSLSEAQSFCERFAKICNNLSDVEVEEIFDEFEVEELENLGDPEKLKELKASLSRSRAEIEALDKSFSSLRTKIELTTQPFEVLGEKKIYGVRPNVFPDDGESFLLERSVGEGFHMIPIFCVAIEDITKSVGYAKDVRLLGGSNNSK
jgi:hypothetical protein